MTAMGFLPGAIMFILSAHAPIGPVGKASLSAGHGSSTLISGMHKQYLSFVRTVAQRS